MKELFPKNKGVFKAFKDTLLLDILEKFRFLYFSRAIKMEKQNKIGFSLIKQGLMQLLLSGKIRVELREDGLHRIRDGRETYH